MSAENESENPEKKEDPKDDPKDDPNNEHYDRLVRVSADFDNFRKRYQREKQDWLKYGAEGFIRVVLPSIDNLERAIRQCPEGEAFDSIRTGLKMVLDQMFRNFQAEGVVAFDPVGLPFDPLLHEAITTKEVMEVVPGTVLEVHHKGFKLWDRLVRPARVTVAVAPSLSGETTRVNDDNITD